MATARNLPPSSAAASPGQLLAEVAAPDAELTIRRFVNAARDSGLSSIALDVVADTAAPYVARLRAFSIVERQLAGFAVDDGTSIRPVA